MGRVYRDEQESPMRTEAVMAVSSWNPSPGTLSSWTPASMSIGYNSVIWGWAWWHIPAFRKQREVELCEFEPAWPIYQVSVSQSYIARSCLGGKKWEEPHLSCSSRTERWDCKRDTHHDIEIVLPPTLGARVTAPLHVPSSASALLTDFSLAQGYCFPRS